jgi:membrane fusion protein (multidrug efflux system)
MDYEPDFHPSPLATKRPSRLKKWAVRIFILLVVLGLMGGTGFMLFMKIKFADFQPPMTAPDVIVSAAAHMSFSDKIEAIGTAEANQSATLTATVTETIQTITVNEGEFVKAGTVIVELTSQEEQATLSEASKSFDRYDKLARSKIGSEARRDQEQARMGVARAQLEKRRIVAPFDGVLGIRRVSVGDLVSPGTVITTIDELDPIKLEFSVPENYISVLRPGLTINATTEAYPGEIFTGVIAAVDSRINSMTRAVLVKATIPNHDGRLRPGLLMKLDVVRSTRSSIAIPEQAVISTGDKKTVFVVGADNKVVETTVTSGNRQAGYIEVLSGLKAGEKVIIEGLQKAADGAEVKIAGEKNIEQTIKEALEYASPRKQEAFPEANGEPSATEEPLAADIPELIKAPETFEADPAVSETPAAAATE